MKESWKEINHHPQLQRLSWYVKHISVIDIFHTRWGLGKRSTWIKIALSTIDPNIFNCHETANFYLPDDVRYSIDIVWEMNNLDYLWNYITEKQCKLLLIFTYWGQEICMKVQKLYCEIWCLECSFIHMWLILSGCKTISHPILQNLFYKLL